MRHPILYAEQFWQKQRFGVIFLIGVGSFMAILNISRTGFRLDTSAIWIAYVPAGLLLFGLLQYYRRRHQLVLGEEGVTVSKLVKSVHIDYDRIRWVRVQPLRQHFQDSRARMGRQPITRALLDEPAVFFKFQGDEAEMALLHKQLGTRLHHDDTAAFPVKDPEAVMQYVATRIPKSQAQANMGGGKRRKRRR